MRAIAHEEPDVRRFMLRYATMYVEHVDAHHGWWTLWMQKPPISEGRQDRLNQLTREVCEFVAGVIAERTDVRDPQITVEAFSGALFTLGMFRNRLGAPRPTEDFLNRLIDGALPSLPPSS